MLPIVRALKKGSGTTARLWNVNRTHWPYMLHSWLIASSCNTWNTAHTTCVVNGPLSTATKACVLTISTYTVHAYTVFYFAEHDLPLKTCRKWLFFVVIGKSQDSKWWRMAGWEEDHGDREYEMKKYNAARSLVQVNLLWDIHPVKCAVCTGKLQEDDAT